MNKILVSFFSMTLVLMLSMVSTTINTVEASSSHASSSKAQKHKKTRHKRKHRRSKSSRSKSRKARHKKKRRSVKGCQTLSRSTLQKKASPYHSSINSASKKYGVSKNLIKAVITIESCFRSKARGALGEKGLMQLMPKTAKHLNVKNGYNVSQNVHGGAKYLSYLLKRYNGNMQRAVAAYNAGAGNIDKGRIPNRRYVNKVLHAYRKFSSGKSDVVYKSKRTDKHQIKKKSKKSRSSQKTTRQKASSKQHKSSRHTYTVKQGDTVYEVMRQTGTSVKKIIRLNGLHRPYYLKAGQTLQVLSSSKAKRTSRKPSRARAADAYIVQANDTIYNVMRQTGVPIEKIIRLNNLSVPYRVSVGQELRLK